MIVYKFIFILLIIIKLINCQIIPITTPTTLNVYQILDDQKYFSYPLESTSLYCNLNLQFLVRDTSTNNINSQLYIEAKFNDSQSIQYANVNYIQTGNGFSLFTISTQLLSNKTLGITNYNIELIATSNYSISDSYEIKYDCYYPFVPNNISVYIMQDIALPYLFEVAYCTIKIDGLNFNFSKLYSSLGQLTSIGDNIFIGQIQFTNFYNKDNIINITISLWNELMFLNISNPFISSEAMSIDQIITYPNNIIENPIVTQFGFLYLPFYTYRINSMLDFPLIASGPERPIPLFGNRGNMTYKSRLARSGSDPLANVLFYFNGTGYTVLNFIVGISNLYPFNIPTVSVSYSINSLVPMFMHSFLVTPNYFYTYKFEFLGFSFYKSLPFGRVSGNNINSTHQVAYPINEFYGVSDLHIAPLPNPQVYSSTSVKFNNNDFKSSPPKLLSYQFKHIIGTNYLLRFTVFDIVGLTRIQIESVNKPIGQTLVEGNEFNGTYELVFDISLGISLYLINSYGIQSIYYQGTIISVDPLYQYQSPTFNYYFNEQYDSILEVSFLYNNISLIKKSSYNIAYIKPNLNKISKLQGMKFLIRDHQSEDIVAGYLSSWNAIWDETLKMFVAKFILPKGSIFGKIQYGIRMDNKLSAFNYYFTSKSQLVVQSTDFYDIGPYFSKIDKIPSDNVIVIPPGESFGWRITIKEDYYGFSKGYIRVVGSIDNSIYHFNFTLPNALASKTRNKFESAYEILLNITSPCFSQDYLIEYVELTGTTGIQSLFGISQFSPDATKNPFKLFLADPLINRINSSCSNEILIDPSPPILTNFTSNATIIDVTSNNRIVTFNFTAVDNEIGLKNDQLPIVYLITKSFEILECQAEILEIISYYSTSYSCSIEIPYGFGYPGSIALSVYGFINNGGNSGGFTSFDLQTLSAQYYINTTSTSHSPFIKSNEAYLSDGGGDLILYGYGFENCQTLFFNISGQTFTLFPSSIFSSVIIKNDFYPVSTPFTVKAQCKNSIYSNVYTVYPIYFNTSENAPTPTPTPSPTSNAQCPGLPEPCGGSKRGYCSNGQCICFSPFVGLSCQSQVIIVPQPSTNTTDPTIEIPTTNENSSDGESNVEQILFKSLISMVSLRELDYLDKQVKQYIFDKWVYTKINDNTNLYFTNITSTTNITVKLEWFTNETFISFADFNLTMNPSTIKYTIEINEYQFINQLNKLQLIMSASFSASKSNDICSVKEFGSINDNTDNDSSNYLKIQIDNHSLYGRFIKRALIDGSPKTIDNVLLDSSFNTISSNQNNNDHDTASSVQSYIGITIPNYYSSIIIDPDFSVLIDSNSISAESNNAVCNLSKSGLTSGQLAGIIIGSVAFACVITIIIIYSIYQHKKSKKFALKINRLNKLNKDN